MKALILTAGLAMVLTGGTLWVPTVAETGLPSGPATAEATAVMACKGMCDYVDCTEGGHEFYLTIGNEYEGNSPHSCGNVSGCECWNSHCSCTPDDDDQEQPELAAARERLNELDDVSADELVQLVGMLSDFSINYERGALQRLSCSGDGSLMAHVPLPSDILRDLHAAQ